MKTRILAVLLVLLLALGLVSVAGAQDTAGCYNLAAEDCAVINSASTNSGNISSFFMNWTLDISAEGLGVLNTLAGGGVPESMSFSNTGQGPFVIDPEADFPITLYADMTASATVGGETTDFGAFPFAIVNGHAYVPTGEVVAGIPLSVLLDPEALGLNETLGGMGIPTEGMNFDFSTLEITTLGDLFGGSGDAPPVDTGASAFLIPYVNYARLPDEEMMGQGMYPFEFTLNLGGLLNSPEFSSLLSMAGGFAPDDPNTQAMLQMVPMLLGGLESEIAVTEWVGADDNFIHRLAVDMTFNLDLSALAGGQPADPVMVTANFAVDLSQINEALEVPVPAGAVEFTEEQAAQMLGGM